MWRKWIAPGTLGTLLSSSLRNSSSCDPSEKSHNSATSVAIISSITSLDSLGMHLNHELQDLKKNGQFGSNSKVINDQDVCHIDFNHSILTQCDGVKVAYDICFIALSTFSTPLLRQMVDSVLLQRMNGTKIYAATLDDLTEAKQRISKGEHITIVGAYDWSTIAFAASLASYGRKCGYVNSVTLVYPSFGPLSGILPRFLSLSLAMRFQSKGVEVAPYSQVRYLSDLVAADSSNYHSVLVYLARSYDSINTSAFPTDAVVFGTTPLTQKLRDDRNDYHFTNPFQSALIHSDLELDSLSGGILVNKSLQSQHNVFIAGYGVNVPYQSHQRSVVQGERDAYISLQTTLQILQEGETKSFQKRYPCHVMASPELNVSFISFGLCSSALESHSHFWRIPSPTQNNNRVDSAATYALPKPSLSKYMKKDFQDILSLSSSNKNKAEFVPPAMNGPRGRYALYKLNITKKRNNSALSTEASNNGTLWSMKNAPLGTGITFYIHDGKISGILLSGFATTLLYNQVDSVRSMRHDRMDQLEEVLGRYIGKRVAVDETISELLDAGTVRLKMVEQIGSDTNQLLEELASLFKLFLMQQEDEDMLVKFEEELQAFRTSARRTYRYCQVSRTTVMEMNDHFNKQMVGKVPQRLAENIFQLKSNEGSRSDRMNAAYSSNILQAMMNEQGSNRKS